MKDINNYIVEKLHLNKDNANNLDQNKYLCKYLLDNLLNDINYNDEFYNDLYKIFNDFIIKLDITSIKELNLLSSNDSKNLLKNISEELFNLIDFRDHKGLQGIKIAIQQPENLKYNDYSAKIYINDKQQAYSKQYLVYYNINDKRYIVIGKK